jgi:HAD superfamily hydrolase (TIGR01509 family)
MATTPSEQNVSAVVFDMDGVLLDSEQLWDEVRENLARERGGRWHDGAQADMMGMSSPEWSRYMHDTIGLAESAEDINAEVVRRLLVRYRESLPLIDGAVDAVERLARRWPLGLASSSNREVIDAVLAAAGIADRFRATVSSEEVARGKPAPDVYLEAARQLRVDAGSCVAIEDSRNGIASAHAAGMRVIAIPNPHYPPSADVLAAADDVVTSLGELTVGRVSAFVPAESRRER